MLRRSALRLLVLLVALALVLPWAAMAGSCADCLDSAAPHSDCCPPSCCSCCLHSGATLNGWARLAAHLREAGLAGDPVVNRALPADPRDVFHVPKSFLV
jgi:hypothetical protein